MISFQSGGDPARTRSFIEIIGFSVPTFVGAARFASIGYAQKFQLWETDK